LYLHDTPNFELEKRTKRSPETSESASSTSGWDTDGEVRPDVCRCSFLLDDVVEDGVDIKKMVALFDALVLRNNLEGSGDRIRFELLLLRSEKQPVSSTTDQHLLKE
jgi:hypothetical protein